MDGASDRERSRITVAVVFGGRSTEHAISCVSAGSVLAALDPERYNVVPVGISVDGAWSLQSADPGQFSIRGGAFPHVDAGGQALTLVGDPTHHGMSDVLRDVDVVFPVLHGPWGEDGTLQGLFELAGIPYVGSGVFASAAAMDKGHMKAMFRSERLPVGEYLVVTDSRWRTDAAMVLDELASLGLPVFVKPSRAGSSLGIRKVSHVADLRRAIENARAHDPRVIVEAAVVDAREIECGVLAGPDGKPEVSVCAEIVVSADHEFYDFDAKYLDDGVDLVVPADLTAPVSTRIRELAIQAYEVLGCEGLARVDFFLRGNDILINELNTMPGFTPTSMFPLVWAHSGVDYPALVDRLLADALRRGTGLR